jgi:hypothetical protein
MIRHAAARALRLFPAAAFVAAAFPVGLFAQEHRPGGEVNLRLPDLATGPTFLPLLLRDAHRARRVSPGCIAVRVAGAVAIAVARWPLLVPQRPRP